MRKNKKSSHPSRFTLYSSRFTLHTLRFTLHVSRILLFLLFFLISHSLNLSISNLISQSLNLSISKSSLSNPQSTIIYAQGWNVNLVGAFAGSLPQNVFVQGNYAYVAADGILSIVDISNPSKPQQVGFYDTHGSARGVFVSGNYAYVADGGSGLWILQFTGAVQDTTPPSPITNLQAILPTANSITLTWTATGDDGNVGTATTYDIRYSTATITDTNWATATQCTGEPTPKASGQSETFVVSGLSPDTTYYFAIKVADEANNWSGLSNVVSAKTDVFFFYQQFVQQVFLYSLYPSIQQ